MSNHEKAHHENESLDIVLRSLDEVARRAVLLISLVRRAALEQPEIVDDDEAHFARETDRFELYSWARKELVDVATPDEIALLRTPGGELTEDQSEICLSAAAPANALCWALGAVESIDPADSPDAEVDRLLTWTPEPWAELRRFTRKLSLRDEETLARERERWELWHWRASLDPSDPAHGDGPGVTVADIAAEADAAGLVAQVDGDFAVGNRPFRSFPIVEQAAIAATAEDYLIALNWVCGFGGDWDDVPLYPE